MRADWSENICLCNSMFTDECRNELKEINKHDIIISICEILGPCPSNICKAEEIFEKIKFSIANFIIHHEYNPPQGVSLDLLYWLDSKTNPAKLKKLDSFIKKYFK